MGSYETWIAGLQYRDRGDRVAGARLRANEKLTLVLEPGNPYDENAVRVLTGWHHLGYVKQSMSHWVAERIREDRYVAAFVREVTTERSYFSEIAEDIGITIATAAADAPYGTPDRIEAEREAAQYEVQHTAARRNWAKIEANRDIVADCFAILRWVGKVGETESERQQAILDDYVAEYCGLLDVAPTADHLRWLRARGEKLKGSKARTAKAVLRVADQPEIIPLLAKTILRLVNADGVVSEDERRAVLGLIEEIRAARATK